MTWIRLFCLFFSTSIAFATSWSDDTDVSRESDQSSYDFISLDDLYHSIEPGVLAALRKQWEVPAPKPWRQTALFIPRALEQFSFVLLKGQTSLRLRNTALIPWEMLNRRRETARNRFNHSIFNPLPLVSDVISDVGTLPKTLSYGTAHPSRRIKVCSSSLNGMSLLPMLHIEIAVDGIDEDGFPERFKKCQSVPIFSREPESISLQRLTCVQSRFHPNEDYFTYNCGAKVRDTLKFSGMGFPMFPNFGLGSSYPIIEKKNKYTDVCNQEMESFQAAIIYLEAGEELIPTLDQKIPVMELLRRSKSRDLVLQLIISAARGKNLGNRQAIKESIWRVDIKGYIAEGEQDKPIVVKRVFRNHLKKMFASLDMESVGWIAENFPEAHRLHLALKLQPVGGY